MDTDPAAPPFPVRRGATEIPRKLVLTGRAALARSEVDDAKRTQPDRRLDGYAAARGLDFLGSGNAAGYLAALPRSPDEQFNVVRGPISAHRHACLWHWRRAFPIDSDGELEGGPFFGVAVEVPARKGAWKSFIPLVGWALDSPDDAPRYGAGVPCSAAATGVPEAALLPDLVLSNPPHDLLLPHRRSRQLVEQGLPDWRLTTATDPTPDQARALDRWLRGPLRAVLEHFWQLPLFELRLNLGTLSVCRNGYADDAHSDELFWAVGQAGDALRDACAPLGRPQRFDAPLPPAEWPEHGGEWGGRVPSEAWLAPLRELSARLGMAIEDPEAYHRAFPSSSVPGRAFAVLRGALPGSGEPMRIVFHREGSLNTGNLGRTAVLLPAGGAPPTPPGGVRTAAPEPAGYTVAVAGGVLAVWQPRNSGRRGDLGDVDGLLAAATGIARSRR